jgi:thymidylate kinase
MKNTKLTSSRPVLVSFSGVDGAGKSTQIELLCSLLRDSGYRIRLVTFWDDVAALKQFREFSSHKLFNSEQGVGSPDNPVNRRDKNVRAWYMTLLRYFLYLLDAVSLGTVLSRIRRSDADVVVCDRYTYDEVANLDLKNSVTRAYARFLLKVAPTPDVAYILDADPEKARARKPEYPIDFIRQSRASYLALERVAGVTVIPPGSVAEMAEKVATKMRHALACKQHPPTLPAEAARNDDPILSSQKELTT